MKTKFIYLTIIFMVIGCSNADFETGTIERKFVLEDIIAMDDDVEKVGSMEEVKYKIYNDEIIYELDDFIKIPKLKKSEEFPVDLKDDDGNFVTPKSTGIYTMFYRHSDLGPLDLELRLYDNNKDAKEYGKNAAEKSISTVALTIGGHVRSEKYLYDAYVLKGNAILLCQNSLDVCDEIYEKIEK